MTNKDWFKSLDRNGRKHVLSILHEGRVYVIAQHTVELGTLSDIEDYIKEYEDLHEEMKRM